jgi:predicted glycogen debranching enzyme
VNARIGWRRGDGAATLVSREWLVTNGLGGYASGTVAGVNTRRYHGLLVAALPNPLGRTMMFNHLSEQIRLSDGTLTRLCASRPDGRPEPPRDEHDRHDDDSWLYGAQHLAEFRLELGLPVWTYELGPFVLEKRIYMPYLQNTVHITYRLLSGDGSLRMSLRPAVHFRSHDAAVNRDLGAPYTLSLIADRFELSSGGVLPPLRVRVLGDSANFVFEHGRHALVSYRAEEARGYEAHGELWSHGHFKVRLTREHPATLIASTEPWETVIALGPDRAMRYETDRRNRLISIADCAPDDRTAGELVLAGDQFLIAPAGRIEDATRARAQGEELRTVIAGYHWFTDWGRDTMISLEGLALVTGRPQEARWILHSFAHYVRDGLIPNMFPEGAQDGLYNTADATLWFFHALDRYLAFTSDTNTLSQLLPLLQEIIAAHRHGTRYGIHMDPDDGLLTQGQEGYQLTWMDAKCDGWVVTPRRGKAVEINALWYNALRLLERWQTELHGAEAAADARAAAARVERAFNARFWNQSCDCLYDVVDQEGGGNDEAFRPNQLFAISLPNPVLARERWKPVVDHVGEKLLTPCGLRSLAREHRDYKPSYHGDLRTRDAAYHQGTVWSWLIGPFIDAYLKVYPERRTQARQLLGGLEAHLGEACVGSVSEVFDAEPPFTPRGCIAQAWGVAELLRTWLATAPQPG